MKRRSRVSRRASRRIFRKTARRVHRRNNPVSVMRGGIRL